jgi:predicted Zn-dependent peptidase
MTSETKKALTGLEWAIAQTIDEPQQEDEFTAEEFARASNLGITQARNRLDRMTGLGQLSKRKILIDGRQTNLFRKAD